MAYIFFISLACGAATARIVGGADTLENQIPWQCNFYYSDDSWSVHFMIKKTNRNISIEGLDVAAPSSTATPPLL